MRMIAAALVLACAAAQPAAAQDAILADRMSREAELADQNRRSEALNAEVNRRNAEVDARNAAVRAAHEKAEADYRKALEDRDAAQALAVSQHLKAMEAWRIAVAACRAGDLTACEPHE
ncbi:hypothetical protein ACO2Q0_09040 [Phenylobacterium sp. VNQ135]|uniref:hypothetical protein n=1 Tax=Phenylobacterium sp. VNQ135 TaxID=3400922 RepID=UPI003C061813